MKKDAFSFLVVGVLLGALPGFFIGQRGAMQSESESAPQESTSSHESEIYAVPKSKAECYVAVANSHTDRGARVMEDYCYRTYGDL